MKSERSPKVPVTGKVLCGGFRSPERNWHCSSDSPAPHPSRPFTTFPATRRNGLGWHLRPGLSSRLQRAMATLHREQSPLVQDGPVAFGTRGAPTLAAGQRLSAGAFPGISYSVSMTKVATLLKEASKLDLQGRAELVSSLLEDLDPEPHYISDEEVLRRHAELKSGEVEGLSQEAFWKACGRS